MHVYDIWKIFKLQSVSLIYDVSIGHNNFEFICMILNKNIHDHNTRGSAKDHFNTVSSLDTRNFVYHSILNWNNCPRATPCRLRILLNGSSSIRNSQYQHY